MQKRPLDILITNDDGYFSKGINVIAKLLSKYGNITVIAPQEAQSGMSTALTMGRPLRFTKQEELIADNGNKINKYILSGTPADCVKMAMNSVFANKLPDLLVSGINHGSNASAASVYSGTLGATAEGTLYGIPSIGLSIDTHSADPNFSIVEAFLPKIMENFFSYPVKEGSYLNINFPDCSAKDAKGIKFAAQGKGRWIKEFEKRTDPRGKDYYWMCGDFLDLDNSMLADHKLLEQNYITIVPHKIDNTDYSQLKDLEKNWNI